ncbi:MAG: isochorismatase family protein [Proteobacteria bacterium]|nr:isochorismatase family protein [Pseudomonadota bacterium]
MTRLITRQDCLLLAIDFQERLMPAIHHGEHVKGNARRLIAAADLLDVPLLATEQNSKGLGHSARGLLPPGTKVIGKMTFDACAAPDFPAALGEAQSVVVTGCEAHVCVLQTVAGLIGLNRRVIVVRDAIGSRTTDSREAAIARMARFGAEIVTTEMVIFEWLGTATHPKFREVIALVK